jgi:hypothetical protein
MKVLVWVRSVASILALLVLSLPVSAACPVGKQGGGTWCEKGWEWKCERCGSEYCPIMTGRKCVADDLEPQTPLARALREEVPQLSLAVYKEKSVRVRR